MGQKAATTGYPNQWQVIYSRVFLSRSLWRTCLRQKETFFNNNITIPYNCNIL